MIPRLSSRPVPRLVSKSLLRLALSLCLCTGAAARGSAAASDDNKGIRGRIAALARVAIALNDPAAPSMVTAGLRDPIPSVRAAAGRVIHAVGARRLVENLRLALTVEADPEVAFELAWAIADLETTGDSDAALREAAQRPGLGGAIRRGVALGVRGADASAARFADLGLFGAASSSSVKLARTPRGYPSNFVESVLEDSKCRGTARAFEMADIEFTPAGRPRAVGAIKTTPSSGACNKALQILAFTALNEGGEREIRLTLPSDSEFISCLMSATATKPAQVGLPREPSGGSSIREPRKIKNQSPIYPGDAIRNGVEGVVVMEATISETGCVTSVSVTRSPHFVLEASAIVAVAGWKYTPTLLGDVAVPITMTVSVNFKMD